MNTDSKVSLRRCVIAALCAASWSTSLSADSAGLQHAQVEARRAKSRVEATEKNVETVIASLEKLADLGPRDFEQLLGSIQGFRQAVRGLRARSEALLESYTEFKAAMAAHVDALVQAPSSFKSLGAVFVDYASQEPDPFFKEEYSRLASQAQRLANNFGNRQQLLLNLESDVAKKKRFLDRSLVFCDRLDSFLEVVDYDPQGAQRMARYIKAIDDYISLFERAMKAWHKVADGMETGANTPANTGERRAEIRSRPPVLPVGVRPVLERKKRSGGPTRNFTSSNAGNWTQVQFASSQSPPVTRREVSSYEGWRHVARSTPRPSGPILQPVR